MLRIVLSAHIVLVGAASLSGLSCSEVGQAIHRFPKQDAVGHVILPGYEQDIANLFATWSSTGAARGGWVIDRVQLNQESVVFFIAFSDAESVQVVASHPDIGDGGALSETFAMEVRAKGESGRNAGNEFVAMIQQNDPGIDLWGAPQTDTDASWGRRYGLVFRVFLWLSPLMLAEIAIVTWLRRRRRRRISGAAGGT